MLDLLKHNKLTFIKMLIVATPSLSVAFLTEKVVYVVPTIAMMMMIASALEVGKTSGRNRLDEENQQLDKDVDGQTTDGGI